MSAPGPEATSAAGTPSRTPSRASVGLAVYNGMPHLRHALESVLAQDLADLEILISDNASEDGTGEYCEEVAASDPRVRYYRNDVNLGAAVNFQRVLDLSSAPYFAWAAHDDWYAPSFVSRCLEALVEHPEAGFCVPARRRVDGEGAFLSVRQEPQGLASDDLATRLKAHLRRRGWLTLYGLWRRDFLERLGPIQTMWGADVVYVWRALLLAPAVVLSESLADYRVVQKTVESVMLSGSGVAARLRFPNSKMVRDLRKATTDLDLSPEDVRTVQAVLRRWMLTHHYRELVATDLLVESGRLRASGSKVAAAVLLAPAAAMGPRMALKHAKDRLGSTHEP